MGKTVAEARDVPGFLANRMLLPMLNEAAFCLYEGVGDAEAIDTVMRLGMNHPMGPLALADLIGLDTCLAILEVLHDGFGDPTSSGPARCGASTSRRGGSAARPGAGSTSTRNRSGQFGALATVALWCSSFALIKHLVDAGLAAPDVALGRYLVAAPGFAFLFWRAGGLPGLRLGEAVRILVAVFGGVTVYHLALNAGERTTASGVAAVIVALGPATTLALALAVGLESFAPRRLAGIALAFAGVVVVVVLGTGASLSVDGLRGPLLVLLAPCTFALYNILFKPLLARYDLLALTAAGGLLGTLLFVPFETAGVTGRFGALDAGGWLALVALGLGATLAGYVTWSIALRGLDPSRAMSYLYLVPPLSVAIGALALDEPITAWLLLGGGLVIGGVALAQRQPARAPAVVPPRPCAESGEPRPWAP